MTLIEGSRINTSLVDQLTHELEEVVAVFDRQLMGEHEEINDLCGRIEEYRGKMLRPTLVFLSGLLVKNGRLEDGHKVAAAVVEMIHMATLVHDDVLDEAEVRRRGRTINDLHGNEMAVMLGDFLISNAFHLCSTLGKPWVSLELGSITNTLCEGELIQLFNRNNNNLDQPTYMTIVEKKTASLIGASCRLGSRLSGAGDEVVGRLERFGRKAGVAFQITDDVLDLTGEQDVVGKSVGRDLDKGKLTLPMILGLGNAGDPARKSILEMINERDLVGLRSVLEEVGGIEEAMTMASNLVAGAKGELDHLPESPAREMLGTLADGILDRKF